jgi:anhydro-N-acetylmuramic acid kinase
MAWLAKQTLDRKPVDLRSITGSESAAILGGVYWA